MTKSEITNIINSITEIKTERNYWFVRTQGGDYYKDFLNGGYIAIGYDIVSLLDIKSAKDNEIGKTILTEIIRKKFPDEQRPGFISQQLIDFSYSIKKGDIVIIPSYSSEYISIGEVKETPIFQSDSKKTGEECPFLKRKAVKWLKRSLLFDRLDSEFITLKYSQKTITKLSDKLKPYVDRVLVPLYIKEENAHLSIAVQKNDNNKAYAFFQTWSELLELTEDFGKENNLEIDKESFDLKINVQSPGTIEFITYSVIGLVTLSVMIVAIIGADFESKSRPFRFAFKSEGLMKKVSDYLNAKQHRLLKTELIKKVQEMEIKPDELVKILENISNDSGKN